MSYNPADPFNDPEIQRSLQETDPSGGAMQFDARALFELLRRRGLANSSSPHVSGFIGAGPQEMDANDPSFALDMRGGYDAGPQSQAPQAPDYSGMRDVADFDDPQASPMASHAARKQAQPGPDLSHLFNYLRSER